MKVHDSGVLATSQEYFWAGLEESDIPYETCYMKVKIKFILSVNLCTHVNLRTHFNLHIHVCTLV